MRSHAKASSAGSNSGRGANSSPFGSRGLLFVLALIVAACLLPASASAGVTHPFLGSFCEPTGLGTAPCEPSFAHPAGMAVDPATGDLLVIELEQPSVPEHMGTLHRFKPNGEPDPFSALGTNVIDGHAGGEDATPEGEILSTELGLEPVEAQVAVAPPSAAGGTAGNIYVTDAFHEKVDIFESTGKYIGQIAIGYSCGVAVAPDGTVYVGDYYAGVHKLTPTAPATFGPATDFSHPETCQVAAGAQPIASGGSEGFVFATGFFGGVAKIDVEGEEEGEEKYTVSDGSSVSVDPATGHVFTATGPTVNEFDVSGAAAPAPFSSFAAGASVSGLATGGNGGNLYVSSSSFPQVKVFGPPVPLPDAITEDADPVTTTTATLRATANPKGKQLTDCRFEYLSEASYHGGPVQELTVSATGGTFTLSYEGQGTPAMPFNAPASQVEAKLNTLSAISGPGGRVSVSGGPGDGAGSRPYTIVFLDALAYQSVEQIVPGSTSLTGGSASAQILTVQEGEPNSYEGATSVPCEPPAASIPADSTGHPLSAEVSGLSPNTTYHFRLVLETAEGPSPGPDRVITTAIGVPLVSAQSIQAVGNSDATVSAEINPQGAKTTYHVEYGITASYGQSTPESAPIGFEGDDSAHQVSVHIAALSPGTAYHFRFVATSPIGSGEGTDATFATYPVPSSFGPCPNDAFRSGFGARLPDCRAYEQATPTDKHGANALGRSNAVQASVAGNRVTFFLDGGLPTSGGSSSFSGFMASRGPSGWSSDGLLPLTEPGGTAGMMGWSDDLSKAALTVAEFDGTRAMYLRDSADPTYQLAVPGAQPQSALAGFAAADTSHLIFESKASLLPSAPTNRFNLYDLDHGTLTLAGRIPSGSATSCDDEAGPACIPAPEGAAAGAYDWKEAGCNPGVIGGASCRYYTHDAISRDGSRVFFTTGGARQLYVRENATTTAEVSASQRTVPDSNGEKPAAYMAATADGSKVFFTSCEKLTEDSTAVSTGEDSCTEHTPNINFQGSDLYSYDVDSGELSDLTVDSNAGDPNGAEVQGVLGASPDGSYVYFAANGVLAPGASPGNCVRTLGTCNVYLAHGGAITFIARVASQGTQHDSLNWLPNLGLFDSSAKTSRVAADGTLLFTSGQSLTGYPSAEKDELFRYSPSGDELSCVSCNPTNTPPSGKATLELAYGFYIDLPRTAFLTRNLSVDGERVFFNSPDALLPTDTNGDSGCPVFDASGKPSCLDVYEWEAKGSGSCESESQNGGCLYLLSSGTSPAPSFLGDASADGDHVFIFTSQQLVPGDHDELVDVYDAGVGDGLASQHTLAPPTCTGAACQANPAPPPDQPASSAVFSGPGNAHKPPAARRCPKGKRKVRRAGKVSCKKAHKHGKRHSNRGGSK